MTDRDQILIASTRVHRGRLASALAFGTLDRRRQVNTNLRRFVGSVVLAAVAGVGCLGFSLVMHLLQATKDTQALASYRAARAASPLQPTDGQTADATTGYLVNPTTGTLVDPKTGYPVNPLTGLATDPQGRRIDPRTGWYVDLSTGYYTDPATGVTIDPATQQVVKKGRS